MNENILYFCPSLKKEVKSKKYGHFIPLIRWFYLDSLKLLFWFDLGQKYKSIFDCFLVQMKTLEFAFEIYWSLSIIFLLTSLDTVKKHQQIYLILHASPENFTTTKTLDK